MYLINTPSSSSTFTSKKKFFLMLKVTNLMFLVLMGVLTLLLIS